MVRAKYPFVIFIVKTWMDEARLVIIQDRLKFKKKFVAPRRNNYGGQVIFWKEYFNLDIETISKNHIDTTIIKNKK